MTHAWAQISLPLQQKLTLADAEASQEMLCDAWYCAMHPSDGLQLSDSMSDSSGDHMMVLWSSCDLAAEYPKSNRS